MMAANHIMVMDHYICKILFPSPVCLIRKIRRHAALLVKTNDWISRICHSFVDLN